MRRLKNKELTIAVVLSLILHIFLLIWGYFYSNTMVYEPPEEQVLMLDLRDKQRKIADIAPPKKEERPDDAKFIGVHDSRVPEETVASSQPQPPGRPVSRGGEGIEEAMKKAEDELKSSKGFKYYKKPKGEKKGTTSQKVEDVFGQKTQYLPEDFYPDYKVGQHTYLNVLKYPDVAYFVRLKRVFKLAWDPTSALRQYSIHAQISRGKIQVVLGIAIKPGGELSELFVINSSGMDAYDNEALRAVRASAPFSATPEKLRAKDGIVRVSWTFIVYL